MSKRLTATDCPSCRDLEKNTITCHSIVASKTLDGRVHVAMLAQEGGVAGAELSPAEARDMALHMLEAADAAESDAAIMEFGATMPGGVDTGVRLVRAVREYRDKIRARGPTKTA